MKSFPQPCAPPASPSARRSRCVKLISGGGGPPLLAREGFPLPRSPSPSPARFFLRNHALRFPGRFPRGDRLPVPLLPVTLCLKRGDSFPREYGPIILPPSPARFLSESHTQRFSDRVPCGSRPPAPPASCPQGRFPPAVKAFPPPLPLDNGKRLCIYWKRHGTPYRKRSGSAPLARFPPAAAMAVWNTSGQGEPEKEQ